MYQHAPALCGQTRQVLLHVGPFSVSDQIPQIYPILNMNLIHIIVSPRLPYNEFFGGVSGLTVKQFKQVNGFPNAFWGWGGEDDDLWNR